MNTLLLALVLSAPPCFVPSDQTAGWKRVALPPEAPGLAAPMGVDQYRVGEVTLRWQSDARMYLGMEAAGPGKEHYRFANFPHGRRLEVEFAHPLRGAKVDIVAWAGGRRYVLADERRTSGSRLSATWDIPNVQEIVVTVHHHLRETPVPTRWRGGQHLDVGHQSALAPSLRQPGYLYFRHPGGTQVELCHAPTQTLTIERELPQQEAAEVHLSPAGRR